MDAAQIKADKIKEYNLNHPLKVGGKQTSALREIVKMQDGCQYRGTIKQGKREGYGEAWWPDGRYYQGYWKADKPDGQGRLFEIDSTIYEGEWRGGLKSGQGKLTQFGSTSFYEGTFSNDKKNGQGFEKSDFGNYNGEYKDDLRHGKGKCVYSNGDIYEGEFKNDLHDGLGKYTRIDPNT